MAFQALCPVKCFGLLMCCFRSFIVLVIMFKPAQIYVYFKYFAYSMLCESTIYTQEEHTQTDERLGE